MRQLEGVFVQELFKAMRATVPDEGVISGGSAEQMFTGMLDERLAALVPAAWQHAGLEEALLRQFRGHLPAGADPARATGSSVPPLVIPPGPDA
jgi:flagellar protein FlgJ